MLTSFDISSARRIADVVRTIEQSTEVGYRRLSPLTFDPVFQSRTNDFRIAEFEDGWPIGESKTVTLKHLPNTPNTAVAINLFFPMEATIGPRDCAIARDGTSWFLIDVPFRTATALFVTATAQADVVSGVTTSDKQVVVDVTFDEEACQINAEKETVKVVDEVTITSVTVIGSVQTATYLTFD